MIWKWRASNYVSPSETNGLRGEVIDQGQVVIDVFHCNSIDIDPANPDNILVSMRHSGVFQINKTTSVPDWKLGGTAAATKSAEPNLTIVGDPEGFIRGQHDARYQPDGQISIFDDHTKALGAARGVQYAIDASAGTATLSWEYVAPQGANSNSMGSTRRYDGNTQPYDEVGTNYLGPQNTVIGWGHGSPWAGFTEVDNLGNRILEVQFPKNVVGNRTQKVPPSALDLNELRSSSGTTLQS